MITAPFNFVPLSDKVFFPDWAEKVSHDIPFEDAQSGEIDITITAKSPIFVRDGKDGERFCNHNGTYYIPGSSVKGMVRNVLEIMSFSKMSEELFDDDTYAVRDLSNAKNFYMSEMNQHNNTTLCGWLKREKNEKGEYEYSIEDCGVPGRIQHNQIDYALNVEFAKYFQPNEFDAKNQDQKSAEYKYNLVGGNIHTIAVGEKYRSQTNAKYDLREFYKYDKNGKNKAKLILTGQPTPRQNTGKMGDGKGFEFLFFDTKGTLKVNKQVMDNFLFAYFDKRDTQPKESPDWTFWKKKLEKGEKVPVFFQKNGNLVKHFGLSYLYKLPYSHSIKDGIPKSHFEDRLDLAETIFGYIHKKSKTALKSRVQFSHFKAQNVVELKPRTEILGTPRASYYPVYIKQNSTDYKTYMDSNFKIAGWKRYPIHKGSNVSKTTDTGNENVGTTFTPLKEGVVFKGKLRYHNLKKTELGAILSALTFHNTNECYHNIGMAKSLGYGKIDIQLKGIDNIEEYLKNFELEISEQIENWSSSIQLQELLSMAAEQNNSGNSKLEYMELNEFADNKSKTKDFFKRYTKLQNIKIVTPKSLITQEDIEELREKQKQRKEEEFKKEKEKEAQLRHDKEWDIVCESNNIYTLETFIKKYPNSKYLNKAENKIEELKQREQETKEQEAQKEANEKWIAIQKVDKKYYQKALEDFIDKYPNSNFIDDAKQELKKLENKPKVQDKALDFSQAKDGKGIERVIKSIQNPNNEDKKLLEEAIIKIYPTLNAKKKKQFMKVKQILNWIGQDRFNKIIDELNSYSKKDIDVLSSLKDRGISFDAK